IHVIEYPAHELRYQVGLQRPGRVGVADGERHVWHIGQHHSLVGHGVGEFDRQAVTPDLGAPDQLQVQTPCGDYDVGLQLVTGVELDPGFGEPVDGVGDDVGLVVP